MAARRPRVAPLRLVARSAANIARALRRGAIVVAALSIAAVRLDAQFVVRSWLPWRTIETEHFEFHYPADLETWTRDIASRAEAIHSAVERIVGFAPKEKTQVLVDDPFGFANGSAWPFLDQPVINLWAASPNPRDDIGEFRHWGETLLSHEFTHIAHLSRPSRNPLLRRLWRLAPVDVGPLTLNAPRWVFEGYATYVEGKVTGSGRPHGVWRSAFLRQWALEGQLPRYEQLDLGGGYEGGEFAYLAGSAFLEWLGQRPGMGDSALTALWRRMSARQVRTFDEAFAGVFGESARALYGRFSAELTGSALEVERSLSAGGRTVADTGTIIQRLAWTTGDPALSSDGKRVALVVRSATMPSRVVVWSTASEPDTGKAKRDSILLAHDPEDVPARPIYPPPKKALATLRAPGGSGYDSPRFLRDGRILVTKSTAQGDGTLRSDLYLWNVANHDVERLTHGASLFDADPLPDGRTAIATQCRSGWCDVVSVSLADGATRTLLPGSPSRSYYRPRISPDGARFIVAANDGDGWKLRTARVDGSVETPIASPDANAYDASWIDDTRIVAVSEHGGISNLARYDAATATWSPLTRLTGAAVAPVVNPADSSIWFLSLYSRGYDVRRITVARPVGTTTVAAADMRLVPAVPTPVESRAPFAKSEPSKWRPFGLSPRSYRWLPQPEADADGLSAALGLVTIDLAGRSELLANIAYGDPAAWRGGALGVAWRGMRPSVRVQAFDAEQRLGSSRTHVSSDAVLDTRLGGGVASLDGTEQHDTWTARYRVGGGTMRVRALNGSTTSPSAASTRSLAFADAGVAWAQRGDRSSISESLSGTYSTGRSFDASIERVTASAAISAGTIGLPGISASATYGRTNDGAPIFEQFSLGGSPSLLIERDLLTQRVAMPVLPSGSAFGTSVFTYRAAISTQPLSWYVWAGRTAASGGSFDSWHRVAGVEFSQSIPSISVIGTPSARGVFGVGESLDSPIPHRIRGYMSLVLSP